MQKKVVKCIAWLMLIVSLMTLIISAPNMKQMFGATYNVTQSRYIAEVKDFPLSYQDGLNHIKRTYPNAVFVYYDTGLDWNKDLLSSENELYYGRNLISSDSPSSWIKDYNEVEPGWCQASDAVIKYYMDPRNFLTTDRIFQFMSLNYDDSQTVDGVQTILDGSFMSKGMILNNDGEVVTYAEAMYQIGKEVGVSPYLLACRAKQEQGSGKNSMISGNYSKVPGYYNYFNIGATGSTTTEILTNGLTYAKKQGWNTPYKSIYGGAKMLASGYVESGKDCLYLQHWNVVAKDNKVTYIPYMTSIQAPYYEAMGVASACTSKDAPYVFIIPVYKNMPEVPCALPNDSSSANCLLKSLKVNDGTIDIGKFSSYCNSYSATVDANTSFIEIKAQSYSKKATFAINGTPIDTNEPGVLDKAIVLQSGFNDIVITVIAQNGIPKDYFISILKDDGSAYYKSDVAIFDEENVIVQPGVTVKEFLDNTKIANCSLVITYQNGIRKGYGAECASDDIIKIIDKNGTVVYQAPVIVRGDVNRDGYVTTDDVDIIKSHILETSILNDVAQKAADIDNDGNITVKDLGLVKKLINDITDSYNSELSASIITSTNAEQNSVTSIQLNTSKGTYCADGYIIYDEGKIEVEGGNNGGLIHFVVDGSNVLFDNGCDNVSFSSALPVGAVDFEIIFNQAYDYTIDKNVQISSETKAIEFNNSELILFAKQKNDQLGISYVEIMLINNSSQQLNNISLNLNQYFKSSQFEEIKCIDALGPQNSTILNLYATEKLNSTVSNTYIDISYVRDDCVEKTASATITLEYANDSTIQSAKVEACANCISSSTYGKHRYVYVSNNDATISSNMTQTGVCYSCGQKNIKIIKNSRKQVIKDVVLGISSAYANQTELPTIVSLSSAIKVSEVIWTNSNNEVVDTNRDDFVIINNETYTLSQLILSIDSTHIFDEQITIYINGQQFVGQRNTNENTVTLTNVGQFKF